jgi:hypothetical protein
VSPNKRHYRSPKALSVYGTVYRVMQMVYRYCYPEPSCMEPSLMFWYDRQQCMHTVERSYTRRCRCDVQ